jgi:hypothetical protein
MKSKILAYNSIYLFRVDEDTKIVIMRPKGKRELRRRGANGLDITGSE